MGVWDVYEDRINNSGATKREAFLKREQRALNTKAKDSLSYQTVTVYTQDNSYNISSEEAQKKSFIQDVTIINSDNLDEKTLITLPGEDMDCGNIIYWDGNYWIVEERDANTTIYTKTKLRQCNHLLKWVDPENKQIIEQWCYIEDGTKLKHVMSCDSLAYGKLYVKTTPLIAGNSLELYHRNRMANSYRWDGLRTIKIGQSAAKSRIGKGSTTISEVRVRTSVLKRGALNHNSGKVKI